MITIHEKLRFEKYTNYRACFFGNFYLSSIQQGIQALHVTSDMFTNYTSESIPRRILHEWAIYHKTVILLDGGMASTLETVYDALAKVSYDFPFGKFYEERDAINGSITCVGVILPEQVWDFSWDSLGAELTPDELMYWQIKSMLNKAPRAI